MLLIHTGKENIFGDVQPVEDLIAFIHKSTGPKLKSSNIQNYFYQVINNETKLYKCKYHIKVESERDDLRKKGYAQIYQYGNVYYLF